MALPDSTSVMGLARLSRASLESILHLQRRRLLDLIAFAQARSPFYRELYRDLPWTETSLGRLPPVTKEMLNAGLARALTDPGIDARELENFLGERGAVGRRFIGRYVALRTSGTTGRTGAMIYDPECWHLFKVLGGLRGLFSGGQGYMPGLPGVLRFLTRRHRIAYLVAAGGHFSTAALARHPSLWSRVWCREAIFPIDSDPAKIFRDLDAFQPEILHLYPSFAEDLAMAQEEGRIHIDPLAISTSSEPLSEEVRARLERAFPATRISNCYGATECLVLARQCSKSRWMHVNSDWVVIEPVDANDLPVAYGERSHHVLVTNLANRVLPIIRYRIDDVVTPLEPGACACGSNLPRILIEGRTDDTLRLRDPTGRWIALRPLAIGSSMTNITEIQQFQIVQEDADQVLVRFRADLEIATERAEGRIRETLEELVRRAGGTSLPGLRFERVDRIERDPVSGKIRRIYSRFDPGAPDRVVGGNSR